MSNTMHPPGAPVAHAIAFGLAFLAWLMLTTLITGAAVRLFDAADEQRSHPRPAPSPQQPPAPREVHQ